MTTFLEFVRKCRPLDRDEPTSPVREQWSLFVGDHLMALYRTFYESQRVHLRNADIEQIYTQCGEQLSLHLAYDWIYVDGRIAHASVLALDGVPICAWRRRGREDDLKALILLEPNACTRLARWVYEIAGRHEPVKAPEPIDDVNTWLWHGNEDLMPVGDEDTFFYTVLNPEELSSISQVVTETSYVPCLDGGLLPIYGIGAVQPVHGDGRRGLAAIAHTLGGPRSIDVGNLVHSVLPEEHVRGQDLEALQKLIARPDYWFVESFAKAPTGWSCVVGVHRRGRVYLQWHIFHWAAEHEHKMIEWNHRLRELQPGVLDADVLAAMGWRLGD